MSSVSKEVYIRSASMEQSYICNRGQPLPTPGKPLFDKLPNCSLHGPCYDYYFRLFCRVSFVSLFLLTWLVYWTLASYVWKCWLFFGEVMFNFCRPAQLLLHQLIVIFLRSKYVTRDFTAKAEYWQTKSKMFLTKRISGLSLQSLHVQDYIVRFKMLNAGNDFIVNECPKNCKVLQKLNYWLLIVRVHILEQV